ncbi:MAG TPA: prepilin-type N-terminal cleavage/methylation domain-containing protein [Gallionella sp.]|nr:prepilin-type N-terminal cleavage/methylation domain-containing protein [Gallionella sp.]
MKRNQSGFTLIEIAIVLVIIGLLLGGVLKGQELINSAKVKNLATDFKNVPVFIYGYQDKFKALPGDDSRATTHVNATTNGNGNGIIEGNWNAASGESFDFWQHVRLAGLAPGPTSTTAADYIPKNAVGGNIGVTNSSAANNPITGLKGSYIVCSNALAGKFAKQLDTTLDDGNTATGSMMATAVGTATGGTPNGNLDDDTTYLVCMGF